MLKYYGTKLCPDCLEADKVLAEKKIEHKYIDITTSTKNLKEFLSLRDKRREFEDAKAEGLIGIPCFLCEDGSILFETDALQSKE